MKKIPYILLTILGLTLILVGAVKGFDFSPISGGGSATYPDQTTASGKYLKSTGTAGAETWDTPSSGLAAATDNATVSGTRVDVAVTPKSLVAKMSAPGAIGNSTPATTVTATTFAAGTNKGSFTRITGSTAGSFIGDNNTIPSEGQMATYVTASKANVYVSHSASENANAADMYGKVHLVTGAYTVTAPAVVIGMHGKFRATTAAIFCVDVQSADHHILGGTALTNGNKICSAGNAGDEIEIDAEAANTWRDSNNNGIFIDGGA